MRIIVGLGNPGRRYAGTRHNVGFLVVDELACEMGGEFARRRFNSLLAEVADDGRLLLMKPETYVNDSGRAVSQAVRWHGCPLASLLVVCDDFNLALGRIKLSRKGSAGGHNGLASVIEALGTCEFPRLRLGIGTEDRRHDKEFVLSRFAPEELPIVPEMIGLAVEAARAWCRHGIEQCMNLYNRRTVAESQGAGEEDPT